jgi:predicted MFS family arabinose efflux permease
MGIVSAGIGLGTLLMPPVAERLIDAFGWSEAFILIGAVSGVIVVITALFLRRDPAAVGLRPYGAADIPEKTASGVSPAPAKSFTFKEALRTRSMWTICLLYFFINICVQVVLVHLVNYATDLEISALTAATLVSVIGIGSIAGRLAMGAVADKIGSFNSLLINCIMLLAAMVWLIFSGQIWMLYIFAVIFGFAYGGEVPQIPLLMGQIFGLQAVMALTGATSAAIRAGGALGSWAGGKVFDVTNSYFIAFVLTAVIALLALITIVLLRRSKIKNT